MNKPLLRFAFCFSLLLLSIKATATDYYFSTEIGNDSRSKSEAQNPETPWKSINKLNAIFSSLEPGDAIYFKRGDIFYGTIKISKGGSPGNPIKIDAYGSGEKPIITSFEKVTGWKSIGNGKFESTNSFPNFTTNIVIIDDKIQEKGRYPNRDAKNGGYLSVSSSSGNTTINSNELSGAPNFTNGEIVIRKNQWILDRHTIKSNSGNTIHYSGSGAYEPTNGYGFFIQNHLSTLDQFGEWYYNSHRKLNVYFGGYNPNNYEVYVSTLENLLVKSYNVDHISIQSIHFKGANNDAIYVGEGSDVVINNSEVEFSGENGITSLNIDGLKITNTKVKHSLNTGLNLRYGNENTVIQNNHIENTFPFPGGGQNQDNNGNGIFVSGKNVLVENNVINQIGFNGIHFVGNNITVKNNLIQKFCQLKNDCGGIYTFGGSSITTFTNRVIEGNIIVDGKATNNGTPHHDSPTYSPQGSGIFLDDNVNGVIVTKNTIANTDYSGIKASNTFNIAIKENTFYNSTIQALIGNSQRGADTRNVDITDNIFFSKLADQYSYRINSYKDDINSFGTFNNNYFARPLGDNHSIYLTYYKDDKKQIKIQNIQEWKETFKKDISSSILALNEIIQFNFVKFLGSWLYDNIFFDSNISDFNCNECTQSWDSNGISGGSIKVKSPGYSSALVRIGSVSEDKNYVVKFKAKSNKKGNLRVVLRYAGSPWEIISPSTAVELDTEVKEYSVLIKPYANVSSPVVMFISDVGGWEYWIDDLEINEADVEVTNPDDIFLFEYNASNSTKTIGLNGTFKDLQNNSHSGQIQIEPYSSVLLVKTSSETTEPTPPPAIEHKVSIASPSSNSNYQVGEAIKITAEVTPSHEDIKQVDFYSGDQLIGSSTDHPFSITWKNTSTGNHSVKAVLINDSDKTIASSSSISIEINSEENKYTPPSVGDGYSLYVNLGSNDKVNYEGNEYVSTKTIDIKSGSSNSRDQDGTLFGSAEFNEDLYYQIPVPNGIYTVKTYHKEVHFGLNGVTGSKGKRVFDVKIENETKYSELDLYNLSKNEPVVLTHENIEVKDGNLDLTLSASSNNAIISGFSIVEKGLDVEIPIPDLSGAKFINVGGVDDEFHEGNLFVSDYSTKYFSNSGTSENKNASNSPIFQTIRFAENLIYKIPVENGVYRVETYHIENYFGEKNPDGKTGMRVFDIFIQNELVKNDLDLFARSGNQETNLIFNDIMVKNGELKIELKASVNNALLAGIAIIPMSGLNNDLETDSFFINVGSDTDTDFQGVNFVSEGSKIQIPSDSYPYNVPSSSSDKLFQSNRFGKSLNYQFPVSDGEYTVITYHNENYFGEITSKTGENNRVFDINIENTTVKSKVDLYVENSNRPVTLRFENIKVTDGVLNLDFEGSINNALVSGIAVFPSEKFNLGNSNLRQLITETEEASTNTFTRENSFNTSLENKIFPNPASSYATLQTGQDLGDFFISIHNFNGQLISFINAEEVKNSNGNYEIPVQNLRQGVYIITLTSETGIIERIRLAVTP